MTIILTTLSAFYTLFLTAIINAIGYIHPDNIIAQDLADPKQLKLIVILLIVFAFIAVFGLSFAIRSYRELKNQYKLIELQHNEIAEKNQELAFNNDSLEEINMEKNNVISVVAHDLKTPLGNIQGLIGLVELEKEILTTTQQEYLDIAKRVTHDAAEMVDVMLNVHRIESELHQLSLHEYEILELINKVIKLHEPAANLKKVKIVFVPELDEVTLNTDKQYFRQIISNILQNAIDFSPDKSTIEITLVEKDKSIAISIRDEGVGISETDQKRLFKGYKKLDGEGGKGKSAGIGLAIVLRLVEKLSGRIDVQSAHGKGATFTIELVK